jgi:hypothetical protein
MPSPNSRECWNPAVPPPPVAGAAVGTGLGVGEGLAVGLADGVAVGVIVGVARGVAVGLTLALAVGVGEPVAPGEIGGGVAEGEDPEQAEMATEAKMAKATQPTAVNLALRPVPMTRDGLFITGTLGYAIRAPPGKKEAQPSPTRLAGHERPSETVSRQTTQRYRLGEEQGER